MQKGGADAAPLPLLDVPKTGVKEVVIVQSKPTRNRTLPRKSPHYEYSTLPKTSGEK
jgi:hypothetical protein